jgi:lysophospholipid acyltransferase (LPLAT)-like uncharacterized protein
MAMTERKLTWLVRAGTLVLRLLGATWRVRVYDPYDVRGLRRTQRVIFSLWHGELLPLLFQHRSQNICIVISEHKDGEIVARVAHALGYVTVRGSTSRGGGRALIGLIRALGDNHDGAITPDGPRGPAHVFAPGAAIAAQRSGAPIVAVRAAASRAWRLKSWDRFMIPKPFARVDIRYSAPTPVTAETPREAAEAAPHLEELMSVTGEER